VICPFLLIRHHRVTRESAVGGSPQDRIPLLPGQAFQQPYPERISSQRSHAHAKGSIRASARVWRPLLYNAALWLKLVFVPRTHETVQFGSGCYLTLRRSSHWQN